ncbi:peptidoglycan-binding protein [Kitasatospora cineracea]|uniref:LAGLIDADG DNA endonuclease family protein n=1 Tax=Kitasatospora cineracea TaxID=88074 RepID=A0A3N4SB45_9ACTN|nr:peptidoglycan-binding protein [Kitasatospora cineracea]RPE33614.1 LAGLIDADG DNA endonuclease family protein [Kitasatospora cineracea]
MRDEFTALLLGQVGRHEGRDPDGTWNNRQRYSTETPGLEWSDGQPWCATFEAWAAHRTGMDALWPMTASCLTAVAWWRNHNRWTDYPVLGGPFYLGPDGGSHTGVVVAYDADTIQTVEGNALPLHAGVLTPTGYRRMGDLRVGDPVVDPEGRPSQVTGVHPKGVRPVHRITLQDGSVAEACEEHLWQIGIDGRARPRVVTTLELAALVSRPGSRVRVPLLEPVEYQQTGEPLPIDPYLLGLLIGGGGTGSGGPHFTTTDPDVLTGLRSTLPDGHRLVPHIADGRAAEGTWRIVGTEGRGGNQVIEELRALGLTGITAPHGFLPARYRRAGVKDRLALLQGLMDTGGTIDDRGRIEFTSASERLARDVQELVRSLGGRAAVNAGRNVRSTSPRQSNRTPAEDAHRVRNVDMPHFNPFRTPRKAERFVPRNAAWARRVVSVAYVRDEEVQCIAVSAPSRLFVTDDFIPTHNTNDTGSTEGDGVYLKSRPRRGPGSPYGYGVPAFPEGTVSADPALGGIPAARTSAQATTPSSGAPRWPGRYLKVQSPMLHGDDVLMWQRRMAARGWSISADGWYGPASAQVCRAFQQRHGLGADGIVGPVTWNAAWS